MIANIQEAIQAGLWPKSKPITKKEGNLRLEDLGYKLFYVGKNADLYFVAGDIPKVLLVRTDRLSVFDNPLKYLIEGKGIPQNQLSTFGFSYAENFGIRTALCVMPTDIPEDIARRAQLIELCKPLEIELEGEKTGAELIFRMYQTGSFNKLYKSKTIISKILDFVPSFIPTYRYVEAYGIKLPRNIKEWDKYINVISTPTTKGVKDLPLKASLLEDTYPEIISELKALFLSFIDYAYERGIVIIDTKFEVFLNSEGKWCLGDEVLTTESTRFILLSDFENKDYKSIDKQIARDYITEYGYDSEMPEEIKQQIIDSYNLVLTKFNS